MTIPDFELCSMEERVGWQKLPGTVVYPGRHVCVEECSYLTPSRPDKSVPWTVVHRKPAVVVAPITEDGLLVLIQQERLPAQRSLWEFPAGQVDENPTRESIVNTVLQELDEEIGGELAADGSLVPLGWCFSSQGFTDEHVYFFAARPVHLVRQPQPVGGEHIGEVRLVTPAELQEMITRNVIQNALTLALYSQLVTRGLL
jgi:ADP-ribose pyrophosphatase